MAVSRIVVVGLDGAKPWAAEGKLPTFASLLAEGAHAELLTTLPTLTPPAGPPRQRQPDPHRLAPSPQMKQVDMSDQDQRAIEGMLEGFGYL